MLFTAQQTAYRDTHLFSKIVLDYLDGTAALQPFYAVRPDRSGMEQAIAAKQKQTIDRDTLVQVLQQQYSTVAQHPAVTANIEALKSTTTFTVCTAHQPNLFTGPLYFVYKILHAIRLAAELKKDFPQYNFVPVYYMGSEDADKEELLHTYLQGKRYEWSTTQTGAVGRMILDKEITALLEGMRGQLEVLPFGAEIMQQLEACYTPEQNLQNATFAFVHGFFKTYGLVVLIPDHGDLKKLMQPVFEDDLFQQTPSLVVAQTSQQLNEQYNVQAYPREINLFYLSNQVRNRIVRQDDVFLVHDTAIRFTETELRTELQNHPERFSPNVILRGLFQETILPNIAFVGGGGELAYWLQLKALFQHYAVPFPVLVLRNSFLVIEKKWQQQLDKLQLQAAELFAPELELMHGLLKKQGQLPQLNGRLQQVMAIYEDLKKSASGVDITLHKHVEALKVKTVRQLRDLEKKMMRAERKKHAALQHQISRLKENLFPKNGLQERVENSSVFYAMWGPAFIDELLHHSLALEQQFTTLIEV